MTFAADKKSCYGVRVLHKIIKIGIIGPEIYQNLFSGIEIILFLKLQLLKPRDHDRLSIMIINARKSRTVFFGNDPEGIRPEVTVNQG